jgi:predicted DNA-binding mobile mystery protein A
MITPAEQLDRRFEELRPWLLRTTRPSHGWVKAIRQALGMTTGQMAKRLKVAQTRVSELEAAEAHRNITLKTLDRAAEALGCRVVYILIPARPLSETLHDRAHQAAERQLSAVEQTMRLEDQTVRSSKFRKRTINEIVDKLLRRPSKLWDDV